MGETRGRLSFRAGRSRAASASDRDTGGAPVQPGSTEPASSGTARHYIRTWQVDRRKRTRHLIKLGGLVVKAGIVDLTGDDRAVIFGAHASYRAPNQRARAGGR